MSRCKGIGPVTANKLLDEFITARNIYDASIDEIVCCLGISEQHAMKMMGDKIVRWCKKNYRFMWTKQGVNINERGKKYIDNAKKLPDALVILYYKGNLNFASELERMAIVGSRRCTRDARENCMC